MSKEERAAISRANGAKSRGPKTEAGKERSSRNALKHGDRASTLAHFVPPHEAALCHEDRLEFMDLVSELLALYQPVNRIGRDAVRDIAIARWQIERLHQCVTTHWNLALVAANARPTVVAPELRDIELQNIAIEQLLAGNAMLTRLNREIARLQQSIARIERRLKFITASFPAPQSDEQTQQSGGPVVENAELTGLEPGNGDDSEPPIYVTENVPLVIEAYRKQFPHRRIVLLPPDNVAQGLDDGYDGIKDVPRKAA